MFAFSGVQVNKITLLALGSALTQLIVKIEHFSDPYKCWPSPDCDSITFHFTELGSTHYQLANIIRAFFRSLNASFVCQIVDTVIMIKPNPGRGMTLTEKKKYFWARAHLATEASEKKVAAHSSRRDTEVSDKADSCSTTCSIEAKSKREQRG